MKSLVIWRQRPKLPNRGVNGATNGDFGTMAGKPDRPRQRTLRLGLWILGIKTG